VKNGNSKITFLGFLIFFLTVGITVTLTVIIYDKINKVTNGNLLMIALVMLLLVAFITTAYTVIDLIRRKKADENYIDKILTASKKIASGDFSVRLVYKPKNVLNEYEMIMENINSMAKALEKKQTLNNEFIANFSHEIKTPLFIIESHVKALKNKNLDEFERERYIETATKASKRLSNFTQDLLKLEKIENRNYKEAKEKFNVCEIFEEAVVLNEGALENKNLEIVLDIDEFTVYTEKSLLMIIINNLLSNAIKFSFDNKKIYLTAKGNGKDAVISVKDEGIGIGKEEGGRIFEKFYQADTSRAGEGNGLGLALVKKIIDVLGGTITVKSEKGKGSEFTVSLKDAIL
jgi:signal transduction histidine kinase